MADGYEWIDDPGAAPLAPGAAVLSSFPSVGLAATVAAHYIIRTLELPRIGILDSPDIPPIAIVQSGQVQPPIRVHGRPDLAVVVSEFPPSIASASKIARSILDGAEARKARTVLCLEGVVPHPVTDESTEKVEETVWAVPSRRDAALEKLLVAGNVRTLEDGVIGGVSGASLVAGLRRSVAVAALLVSARDSEGYPDHRAAAAMIESLDRILPELKIDTEPLRSQAELIERALRATLKRSAPKGPAPPETLGEPTIYQ